MHLLQAQPGTIEDGSEPVDLGQTPADLVIISAADTEIAALSQAREALGEDAPTLRLANLTHLQHPMSVDLHLDTCATKSKLVIARILGGSGYWKYGLEQYAIRLAQAGVRFVALPGDDKPDEELLKLSTVDTDHWHALWSYFVEGGPENAANTLRYAKAMDTDAELPPSAKPLLRAGVYWPGQGSDPLEDAKDAWHDDAPYVPIVFYRALVEGAGLHPINRLVRALLRRNLNPLPIFVASLKDPLSVATLEQVLADHPPDVILNCTAFAVGSPVAGEDGPANPLASPFTNEAPVFQVVLSSMNEAAWEDSLQGLGARDIAMNVSLPEVDGRVLTRAVSFKGEAFFDEATQCSVATYQARGDRIEFVANLARNWANLRRTDVSNRKVGFVLANYPNKDGRLANGVGLDTPAATVNALRDLQRSGYGVTNTPETSGALMDAILAGPTNWLTDRATRTGGERLAIEAYKAFYADLPWAVRQQIEERWGQPEQDPFFDEATSGFALSILSYGNVVVGIQPARGYNIDPEDTYHAPDLVPPHNYIAFYAWLRAEFGAHAIVHMGKHGNLEWLPGKALALSDECFPEAILGPTPHIYPFIVNDPGEGTQAKRRTSAVIIDHLTPPLTRAETYGPLQDLEGLVDEYYEAAGVDPRRLDHLRREIFALTAATGLDQDIGVEGADDADALTQIDAYLCELKESQIRDGLHVFGTSPTDTLERDLLLALVRTPRADGEGGNASLLRALADDLGLGFDPLDCEMSDPWTGPKPDALQTRDDPWRSHGDTIERLEDASAALVSGSACPQDWTRTQAVLAQVETTLRPALQSCGPNETQGLLTALAGNFVAPAPSGAPTRGRPDVLPTGRNFFSVDSRAVPTPTAWSLGWKSANLLIERHLQDHGDWPRAMLITAWGTANMRTGGDDVAQALALMGAKPQWDSANRRVTGFEILPLSILDRPRVDVTLRVSGFFRDAFPHQMDLVDSAARAIMELDEPADMNPAAMRAKSEGITPRIFGAKPGAYGAGLQALIDERIWNDRADFADAYLTWGSYAYGGASEGAPARTQLEAQLTRVDAIVQNQDNREHDVLDSDDYYQFEGGAAAAVAQLQGQDRPIYHNDHSRPETPRIRTLDDEIGRVMRSRAVNPKWLDGVKRHGYKGAFEIAATLDYLFAFAATTKAVKNHHFDMLHAAYIEDDDTRAFLEENNPAALGEILDRLQEAIDRGLWTPRSNSARAQLDELRNA